MKVFLFAFCLLLSSAFSLSAQKQVYEIRTYRMTKPEQVTATDAFLQQAYLPALHRLGIKQIGVFKPVANDTASVKMIYVLVPYASLAAWQAAGTGVLKDRTFLQAGDPFLHADTAHLAFSRMESTLIEAFPGQMKMIPPSLPVNEKTVYELRSYESPTDHLHERKVNMFNEGGEILLFKRLGFNAVFYGDVISGSRMPNLMYMTVFESDSSRANHWKTFGTDPEWKSISGNPVNENSVSVSHSDIILMHRAEYSDL